MELKAKSVELFKALSGEYQKIGFEFIEKNNTFRLGGIEIFWMIAYDFSDYIIYKPVLICKEKEITRVLAKLFPSSPAIVTQVTQGYFLAKEFGYGDDYLHLNDQKTNREIGASYKVTELATIKDIIEDHFLYMRRIGFRFLDSINNIQGVHDFINLKILKGDLGFFLSKDRQQEIKRFVAKREILSGIVAAYLLESPNKEEIINRVELRYKNKGPVIRDINIIKSEFQNSTPTASSDLA